MHVFKHEQEKISCEFACMYIDLFKSKQLSSFINIQDDLTCYRMNRRITMDLQKRNHRERKRELTAENMSILAEC